jgi:hypothetical protein
MAGPLFVCQDAAHRSECIRSKMMDRKLGMKTSLSERESQFRGLAWLALVLLLVGSGCSGINASKSVSPLDFLLPSLHMQNAPAFPLTGSTNVFASADLREPKALTP